jgi:hypothetical protein
MSVKTVRIAGFPGEEDLGDPSARQELFESEVFGLTFDPMSGVNGVALKAKGPKSWAYLSASSARELGEALLNASQLLQAEEAKGFPHAPEGLKQGGVEEAEGLWSEERGV